MNGLRKIPLRIMAPLFVLIILFFVGMFLIGSGFKTRTGLLIKDFSVSEDGSEMTLRVECVMPYRYIRACEVKQSGAGCYLRFYAPFGGEVSDWGAKDTFVIPLSEECEGIYFYLHEENFVRMMQKNAAGQWELIPNPYSRAK